MRSFVRFEQVDGRPAYVQPEAVVLITVDSKTNETLIQDTTGQTIAVTDLIEEAVLKLDEDKRAWILRQAAA